MSNRRSAVVTVGAVAAVTALLILSEEPDHDFAAVCVDEATRTRVDDDQCDEDNHTGHSSGGHGWYYISRGSRAPAVGQVASGGTSIPPFSTSSYGAGFDTAGGIVTRGGFGHGFGSFGG